MIKELKGPFDAEKAKIVVKALKDFLPYLYRMYMTKAPQKNPFVQYYINELNYDSRYDSKIVLDTQKYYKHFAVTVLGETWVETEIKKVNKIKRNFAPAMIFVNALIKRYEKFIASEEGEK